MNREVALWASDLGARARLFANTDRDRRHGALKRTVADTVRERIESREIDVGHILEPRSCPVQKPVGGAALYDVCERVTVRIVPRQRDRLRHRTPSSTFDPLIGSRGCDVRRG